MIIMTSLSTGWHKPYFRYSFSPFSLLKSQFSLSLSLSNCLVSKNNFVESLWHTPNAFVIERNWCIEKFLHCTVVTSIIKMILYIVAYVYGCLRMVWPCTILMTCVYNVKNKSPVIKVNVVMGLQRILGFIRKSFHYFTYFYILFYLTT